MTDFTHPRALLLDLDGTLADSLAVMRLAYQMFLKDHQRTPSDAEFDTLNGPPLAQVIRQLKLTHSLQEDEALVLSRYFDVIDMAYSKVTPSEGAAELLQKARAHQCSVGIVTSNTRERTQAWLEQVGFSDLIDFIVAGDEVAQGKPNPTPYLLAIKKTSCNTREIAAVEDSPQGAQASVGAGLRTFVVHYEEGPLWPQGIEPTLSLTHLAKRLWPR